MTEVPADFALLAGEAQAVSVGICRSWFLSEAAAMAPPSSKVATASAPTADRKGAYAAGAAVPLIADGKTLPPLAVASPRG